MPVRPLQPCTQPGCPTLVQRGRCQRHRYTERKPFEGAVRTVDRVPGGRAATYGSARWRKASETFLERHRYCDCGAVATTVDHDPPHDGTPQTFWDTSTWRPKCRPHHNRKSAQEANAKARARKR